MRGSVYGERACKTPDTLLSDMSISLFKLKREPGSGERQLLLGQSCGERGRRQKQYLYFFFLLRGKIL